MRELSNLEFARLAQPFHWYQTAANLHAQACQLRSNFGKSTLTQLTGDGTILDQWDTANKSTFLLGAYALENTVKAFLVYENPQLTGDGRLSSKLTRNGHDLVSLRDQCKLIPCKIQLTWVLRGFQEGSKSWARYPCGLNKAEPYVEKQMTDKLWKGYLSLMGRYDRKLRMLFSRNWRGPNGFIIDGRYEIKGPFWETYLR